MEQTFTPTLCKPDGETPALYSGTVTLRRPNYDERLGLLDSVGVQIVEGDTEESIGLRTAAQGKHAFIRALAKRLPDFFVSADITRLEDGAKFVTLEDMQYDTDIAGVITEACGMLIGKYNSKHPTQPS